VIDVTETTLKAGAWWEVWSNVGQRNVIIGSGYDLTEALIEAERVMRLELDHIQRLLTAEREKRPRKSETY
jgi:hypothetical protein